VTWRSLTLRHVTMVAFGAAGIALLPWTIWLSSSLRAHHTTSHWDLAWSGFDIGLALMFVSTAIAAYRRSPWAAGLAAATGTLLVTDAWFDIVLESHADERRNAILLAVLAELPIAAFCFWIAHRSERVLAMFVEQALHLAPAGEGAAKRDLVGVLEVAPDGETARETRDADATS
jgi:hypothetical protein